MPSTPAVPHPVLQIDDLRFAHPGQPALFSGWSARLPAGVTVVRGGESTGKTTLLRLLAGELKAAQGRLQLRGIDLAAQPEAYPQQVFWADPRAEAFDQVTVLDYLASQRAHHPGFDAAALPGLLEGLSLVEHQHKPLYMLSTGSRRKAVLAAALAARCALTLLDAPFAALDKASIGFLVHWLNAAAADGGPEGAQAWVLADYEAPAGLAAAQTIDLGD